MTNEVTVYTGYQLLVEQIAKQRNNLSHMDNKLFIDNDYGGPRPKSLIEIFGNPNTGKSLLLQQLMARCVIPTHFGGKGCSVILIDLDHKFSVSHFLDSIKYIIKQSTELCTTEECEAVAKKCLYSIIVLSCFTDKQFDLAFDEINTILTNNPYISLLAIDNLNAYYWLATSKRKIRLASFYANKIAKLRQLCDTHNICCAFTTKNTNMDMIKSHATAAVATTSSSSTNQINYKFKLDLHSNGTNTLNERPITIDANGIHFQIT